MPGRLWGHVMPDFREAMLLQKFRLCRADMVAAMSAGQRPPHSSTLRELAELQLVIMATEQAIADKSEAGFLHRFKEQEAA